MPDGEAHAARGGEPAGAPTPRGGGYPPAPDAAGVSAAVVWRRLLRVEGSSCLWLNDQLGRPRLAFTDLVDW
jgi:hypothetical protein